MITRAEIDAARQVAAPYTIRTPQRHSPALTQRLGCQVSLKLEMEQHSGSFKTRGAFHQMLALGEDALSRGVVAVSGGNFARAVAYCSGVLGVDAVICMPESAPAGSVQATRDYGADVELLPDAVVAFARADELAAQGRTALHPFDNREQIAGNAIVALEILDDCPGTTDIIVSIGGGGLIAGVISALQARKPSVRVWGVEPVKAPTMQRALAAGEIVNIQPASLSATLGGPFAGQIAFELCQAHLHELVLVEDLDMIAAQQWFIKNEDLRPELAAASVLAAALRIQDQLPADARLALVICGCNDSDEDIVRFAEMLAA